MEAGVASGAAATGARSVLDKPVHELTEDDISQLTREDCRRYLKEKGMRRPSWNKSQAIQQVISLKSLLEPPPEPASPPPFTSTALQPPPPKLISNSSSSLKEMIPDDREAPVSLSSSDGAAEPLVGPSDSDPPGEFDPALPVTDDRAYSLRDADMLKLPVGQMTIFYSGKVSVFDEVPADKARAIRQLAASSVHFFPDEPIDGCFAQRGTSSHFPGSSVKVNLIPAGPTNSHTDIDGQTSRQVSLQRYLEKRKDRGIFKIRRKIGPPSSGLEMYLNEKMRIQIVSGQTSTIGVSCPTQPEQSGLKCYSIENQVNQLKNAGCAAEFYDKA